MNDRVSIDRETWENRKFARVLNDPGKNWEIAGKFAEKKENPGIFFICIIF